MYTVYILYSTVLNKFYVGSTSDSLEERLRRHLSNHSGFTSRAKDWQCVFSERYSQKEDAQKRGKEIKGWKSANRIRVLIAKTG